MRLPLVTKVRLGARWRAPVSLVAGVLIPWVTLGCAGKTGAGASAGAAPLSAGPDATSDPAARTQAKLAAALSAPQRSEPNRARDVYRHPRETLTFFGLRDDMTVIELWPGGGWYTEILGPVLAARGHLIVTGADPNGDPNDNAVKSTRELMTRTAAHPEVFGGVELALVAPPQQVSLGAPGRAHLVVTFRNLHGWLNGGYADKVVRAAFDALKPGGIFGIEEHRGKPGADPKSGYVDEAQAVKLIESVGFKLAGRSEVNSNPKDTKDYESGVWALPPTLRNGDKDRDKYLAIGESDRFTLKFVKP